MRNGQALRGAGRRPVPTRSSIESLAEGRAGKTSPVFVEPRSATAFALVRGKASSEELKGLAAFRTPPRSNKQKPKRCSSSRVRADRPSAPSSFSSSKGASAQAFSSSSQAAQILSRTCDNARTFKARSFFGAHADILPPLKDSPLRQLLSIDDVRFRYT